MPDAEKTNRRSLPITAFGAFTVVLACCSLIFVGYLTISQPQPIRLGKTPRSYQFRVSGPSMVPSLFGASCPTQCLSCQRTDRVSVHFDQQLPRHRICAVCGGELKRIDTPTSENEFLPGDVVTIQELNLAQKASLRIGDVVAIDHDGKLRVKRIAALPGDKISIKDDRIFVNEERMEDITARHSETTGLPASLLVVDEDWRRTESRWKPSGESRSWRRDEESTWTCKPNQTGIDNWSDWLVYHHRNVYARSETNPTKTSPVMDDYAFNLGVSRRLNQADRLAVSAKMRNDETVKIQTAFWSSNVVATAQMSIASNNTWQVSYYDAKSTANLKDAPVSKTSPVAIRFAGFRNHIQLKELAVLRFVEYRLHPGDRDDLHQLDVASGQAFLVGDNVPVSEDSRQWGVISIENIVGRVVDRKTYPTFSEPARTTPE